MNLGKLSAATAYLGFAFLVIGKAEGQSTFGGNAQHTANFSPTAQNLNAIHWMTAIDLNNTGALAHYGAPLITPANTIFVPVKIATGGFKINVFNAANGTAIYSLSTDYIQPSHNWILPYQPVLATSTETRLYYPGAGGTIYHINNVDSASHGAPVHQVFYTALANYQANAAAFNSSVFINTPITADSKGNVFFGFRVQGTAPAPLSTTQSGFARIDPNGNATYVLAGAAAGDANIGRDTHNSAPALSNDQTTVYVAVKSASTESYGYLLGLDSTTLATKYGVFLKDPRSNNLNNATLLDDSTASPMVAPDNDVYFGIFGDPGNGSRGFMLHFSSDLAVEKTPGGFGWDNTPSIVPATMVPSYTGTSSYLLFSKYNNYANAGGDSGDGVNRIALLDPNATQVDAHTSSNGMLIMREVLTVIGPTPDKEFRSASLPNAVREWCINTAAVNPATNSIFVPSEDGHIYSWNVASNSLTQFLQLNAGVGLPYVPSLIGPDGQVFTLNGGTMSAIGSVSGVGIALTSSMADVRNVVTGQSLTFTAAITNTGISGLTPTGTVTLQDTVYSVPSPGVLNSTTTTLASNIFLDGTGHATYTASGLTADRHFITASYSGDGNFSAGRSSLVQYIHTSGSTTTLVSSPNPSNPGQSVTLTATVAAAPPGSGTPTGMVTFQDGNVVVAQASVNSSGVVSFTTSSLALGSHNVTATYASDTNFAASAGSDVQSVNISTTATTVKSSPNPSVFGQLVTFTSTTTSSGGVPAGAVTFTEGATTWASNVTVDGSGHASFSTTALGVASHTITATFTGATGWGNSSGNSAPQVVNKAASTTIITTSGSPTFVNQPVAFTAKISSTYAPIPDGELITFKDGATTLSSVSSSGGTAVYTTSTLKAGTHTITASYPGDASFKTSSGSVKQIVNVYSSSTSTPTSSLNPSTYGQSVTLMDEVTSIGPSPTGSVLFKNGSTSISYATLNSSGVATRTTKNLPVGSLSITATYGGDSQNSKSTSAALTQTVNQANSATTLKSSLNPSMVGQNVTFTATITSPTTTPTGSVTFMDGATALQTVTLAGGKANYSTSTLSAGFHSITAVFTGNSNVAGSTSPGLTQTVN